MSYIVCEKTYFTRLGKVIEDETNLCDSDNVEELLKLLKSKDIKTSKRTIYRAIKNRQPINNKYFVYKIKL